MKISPQNVMFAGTAWTIVAARPLLIESMPEVNNSSYQCRFHPTLYLFAIQNHDAIVAVYKMLDVALIPTWWYRQVQLKLQLLLNLWTADLAINCSAHTITR